MFPSSLTRAQAVELALERNYINCPNHGTQHEFMGAAGGFTNSLWTQRRGQRERPNPKPDFLGHCLFSTSSPWNSNAMALNQQDEFRTKSG